MNTDRLDAALRAEVDALRAEGRAKPPERVILGYVAPAGERGPRYRIEGSDRLHIRMNSNSYLSLGHHPAVIHAAEVAAREFGAGPGAVRFIDGTFGPHVSLERRIARFTGKPAARIFNSAYTSNLGLALTIHTPKTYWIGDALNHNCIIRAMRIAGVPATNKAIYRHNDIAELERCLAGVPEGIERVIVIFDGVFSLRGDTAPLGQINAAVAPYRDKFAQGLVTVVDDSHGIGAYGATGRGTGEFHGAPVDVIVGTFGKAFGVNGGFVAGSEALVEAVRQKADTYIYSNPLSVADCAGAEAAVEICDSEEGRARLGRLHERVAQFRRGLADLGLETIDGPHPVVPLLVRDTARCQRMVQAFAERGVLVSGLSYPVVPRGDEKIRFQLNAAHTASDVEEVLQVLGQIS